MEKLNSITMTMGIIKYFPLKTRIKTLLNSFRITSIKDRTSHLLKNFLLSRKNTDLITPEIKKYQEHAIFPNTNRFQTLYDKITA